MRQSMLISVLFITGTLLAAERATAQCDDWRAGPMFEVRGMSTLFSCGWITGGHDVRTGWSRGAVGHQRVVYHRQRNSGPRYRAMEWVGMAAVRNGNEQPGSLWHGSFVFLWSDDRVVSALNLPAFVA